MTPHPLQPRPDSRAPAALPWSRVAVLVGLGALSACQTPPSEPPAPPPAPAPVVVAPPPVESLPVVNLTPPPPPPPSPAEQIQTLNAEYLALLRQDREVDAQPVFGRLLAAGLAARQVPMRLLFAQGSTAYWPDATLRRRYAGWLSELSRQMQASPRTCVRIEGYASRQGADAGSRKLATQRADAVRQQLVKLVPALATRLTTSGQVPDKARAAPGTGDGDRRVEFKVVDCP